MVKISNQFTVTSLIPVLGLREVNLPNIYNSLSVCGYRYVFIKKHRTKLCLAATGKNLRNQRRYEYIYFNYLVQKTQMLH